MLVANLDSLVLAQDGRLDRDEERGELEVADALVVVGLEGRHELVHEAGLLVRVAACLGLLDARLVPAHRALVVLRVGLQLLALGLAAVDHRVELLRGRARWLGAVGWEHPGKGRWVVAP